MSYTKNIQEILSHISIVPEFEKQEVAQLYKNNTPFKKFLVMAFDPRITWDLPEGMPPHKRDETVPPDMAYTTLMMEMRTMYVYFAPSPLVNNVKREARFIEMLESLHFKEADLIIAVKDGKLEYYYPGITKLAMLEMFPDVFEMDGIFFNKSWYALELSKPGKDTEVVFVKNENFEQFVASKLFTITDYFTREVYRTIKHQNEPEQIEKLFSGIQENNEFIVEKATEAVAKPKPKRTYKKKQ